MNTATIIALAVAVAALAGVAVLVVLFASERRRYAEQLVAQRAEIEQLRADRVMETATMPRETATVAEFQERARVVITGLRAAGRTPVLVGGSALYTRALLDRFEFPGTDAAVRERWEAELERAGGRALHRRLAELDPVSAERIEADNGRRIVRALEVIEITGKPFSARLPVQEYADPRSVQIGVDIDRETLDARILQRTEEMFEAGFVEEVAGLLEYGLLESRTAAMAIGYREVGAYLAGDLTLVEAKLRTAVKTRQFARRQDAWFRKDPRVVWVRFDDPERVEKAVAAILRLEP